MFWIVRFAAYLECTSPPLGYYLLAQSSPYFLDNEYAYSQMD